LRTVITASSGSAKVRRQNPAAAGRLGQPHQDRRQADDAGAEQQHRQRRQSRRAGAVRRGLSQTQLLAQLRRAHTAFAQDPQRFRAVALGEALAVGPVSSGWWR
jgi:hypothetical protein